MRALLVATVALASVLASACDDPEDVLVAKDASTEAASANPFDGELSPLLRGEYLARHLAGCSECHTPRTGDGTLDEKLLLGGNPTFIDLDPLDDAVGLLPAPNLTPHATAGLGAWSDDEILRALREGRAKDGHALHPMMPYTVFHNLTDDDAHDIVLYLRSVPAVDQVVLARQALPAALDVPSPTVPDSAIPHTTLPPTDPAHASAERGRYLAGGVGFCMFCHTEPIDLAQGGGLATDKLFAGGRKFAPFALGSEHPSSAPSIPSRNLTPHADGIASWSADSVADAILLGVDDVSLPLCPPMPVGPVGAFGLVTKRDAHDIGAYLTTIPPLDNGPRAKPCCGLCHVDGGLVDASGPPLIPQAFHASGGCALPH